MFSFEGNYRSKRNLIFDHTKKLTRDEIVQQTREARKQREDQRKREQSAIKIQACIRGFLSRKAANEYILDRSNEFILEINQLITNNKEQLTNTIRAHSVNLTRLLQRFNFCYRRRPITDHLFAVCRCILSNNGQLFVYNWFNDENTDAVHVFGSTLTILLDYVANLPEQTKSLDFTLPVRVFEQVFSLLTSPDTKTVEHQDGPVLKRNLVWMCHHLSKKHYFRKLAHFIERQLPPTAGYLTNPTRADHRTFNFVEFLKPARTQAFIDLCLLPVKCVVNLVRSNDRCDVSQSLYKDQLIFALNDLYIPPVDNQFPLSERLIRGLSIELMHYADASRIILHTYQKVVESVDAYHSVICSDQLLQPSLNSLHLLLTVVIPSYIFPNDSASVTHVDFRMDDTDLNMGDEDTGDNSNVIPLTQSSFHNPTWQGNPTEAIIAICSVAWSLMKSTNEPHLPMARPIGALKRYVLATDQYRGLSDDDEDDDDDDENLDKKLVIQSQQPAPLACTPLWATQLTEIYEALYNVLPTLVSSAFSVLSSSNGMIDNVHVELIRSCSYLHFYVTHMYNLPVTSLIRLNSVYSEYAIYLRSLWYLIQNTKLSTAVNMSSQTLIFNHLASGKLPSDLKDLQNYLPLIFTFANNLHHRLLCLSDAEICGTCIHLSSNASSLSNLNKQNLKSGCGFKTHELLLVGARLRDLMLGIIEIVYPDQVPQLGSGSTFGEPVASSSPNTHDQVFPDFKALVERVEKRTQLNTGFTTNSTQGSSAGSLEDRRLFLHCWTTLFSRVKRLVFQIYDWNRRCARHNHLTNNVSLPVTDLISALNNHAHFSSMNSSANQNFWITENPIDFSTYSSISLQRNIADQVLTVTNAPFGYLSYFNPDRAQIDGVLINLSIRDIRQIVLLKELPFVIPFERRVRLFQDVIFARKPRSEYDHGYYLSNQGTISIAVRRSHIYEDAYEKLSKENEPNLRPRLSVTFINQLNLQEAGVDGGGPTREFLNEVIRTGFDPNRGFFVYASDKTLYPNPLASKIAGDYLKHFYFLGRILAKAIYEDMLVELRFAYFFLAKLVSRSGGAVGFDYLHSLDPQLYNQLLLLKNYDGDIRELELDFTLTQSVFGENDTVELKPGGSHIQVTPENCVEYIHLVANYKLNKLIYPQVRAFTAGLNDIISIDWFRLFDAEELQTLISGADREIDLNDLKAHTVYIGDSAKFTKTIECFWSVLNDFSEKDKRTFLRFVTACSRPPMFGFRDLVPPFSVQITAETERLPTSSTCANLLRLPDFQDRNILRDRLLYALNANAGFEYS